MSYGKCSLLVMISFSFCVALLAQDRSNSNAKPAIVSPITAGQETFQAYCASCHGVDGKGGGPVAAALKSRPTDLTQLKKNGGGKFPLSTVEHAIQGDQFITAHGTREMPVWGEAFRNANRDEALLKIKIHNLALYIESIQQN